MTMNCAAAVTARTSQRPAPETAVRSPPGRSRTRIWFLIVLPPERGFEGATNEPRPMGQRLRSGRRRTTRRPPSWTGASSRLLELVAWLRRPPGRLPLGGGERRVDRREPRAPGHEPRRPAELPLGLHVRRTPRLRRHHGHDLAREQPREPGGDVPRRLGAE